MAAENIELAKFNFNTDDIVKSAAEIKEALEIIGDEQKELKKAGDQNSTTFVENEAKLKSLSAEYRRHQAVLTTSNKAKLDAVNRAERISSALNKEAKTIDQLRQKNKELNTLRNSANISTTQGRKELELLNEQLDKNNKQIKENVDAYTQQKINIGNYGSALSGVSPQLGMLISQGTQMIAGLKTMRVALAGTSKGLKLFRIALIATGIGAIVVALGLMIGFFLKTQGAVDGLTKILRPIQEIFGSIVGVLEGLGKKLVSVFSNPKKAIIDLKNLIQENIQNRIDGLIEVFGILGDVIKKVFSFDFKGAMEATEGLGEALSKSATGIENLGTKISGIYEDAGEFFSEAIDRGKQIAQLGIDAENQEIAIVQLRAKNLKLIKDAELIAKDQLKTDGERKIALEDALRLTKEIEEAELRLLDTKILQTELSHEANDTSREELLELANLRAERDDKQRESINTELKFLGTKKQLSNEADKRAKKFQDDAIKALKEESGLFESMSSNRAKTLEEENKFQNLIEAKKLEILQKEFENGKISATRLATEKNKIASDQAERETEILIDKASREIDEHRKTAENKLEIDQFLSQAVLENQLITNNALLEKEKEFLDLKLEQGTISQTEFNDAINLVNEENRIANEELENERETIKKEEQTELSALAFEESLSLMEEQGASRAEIQASIDENKRQIEIANAQNSVASEELKQAQIDAINRRHAEVQTEREEILNNQKLQLTQQLLSGISGLIDKNSIAGKAIAVAQAGINTFQGITEGLKAPYPFNIVMPIMAGITGLAAVKKIISTKIPSARGGGGAGSPSLPRNAMGNISVPTGTNLSSENATVQGDVNIVDSTRNANAGIEAAVERGSEKGTNQGANEGITNLSENRQIQEQSAF